MGVGSAMRGERHKVTQNFADCSDFMVDSVVARAKKKKYLLVFYISSLISDMQVFDDSNPIEEDSIYIYSGQIGIPLRRDSSLHKIELCVRDQQLYLCGLRLFVHTGPPIETIFQPSSANYK